ncbi:Capsular polysaccharide synthesis enzyme Cap8C; Manganese-dependent protein-tyrosine phosphatase [hydrothermal vent metagenome]|uniref:Capsular polysaccharide synthesis enzyme Cap8C Manganese-dependent protein-tyrosine phosphatase n=1 Tax=hydrothermal vent metagenome TaxID=652676 RepID=A0A3B0U9W2_9ZZZZ
MFTNWFRSKQRSSISITTDIHSHLLPGLDDGVKTIEESIEVIEHLSSLGFKKLITTPHIMSDYYKNTPEIIKAKLLEVTQAVLNANIPIEIEAAAEYYLDENFYKLVTEGKELLTFGNNYVLFETSFTVEPLILKDVIFKLNSAGYTPVYAHPERYFYLQEKKELLNDLIDQGLLFQLNALSLVGYYSKQVQKMAEELINRNSIAFIGSDTHNMLQANFLQEAYSSKYAHKLNDSTLLNHTV